MKDLLIWLGVLTGFVFAFSVFVQLVSFILGILGVALIWLVIFKCVAYACDFEKRNFRNRNE